MKFRICRTSTCSHGDDEAQPIDGAVWEEIDPIMKDEILYPGEVKRTGIWTIDISTLQDLLNMTNEYEIILIGRRARTGPYLVIELYDDYRE